MKKHIKPAPALLLGLSLAVGGCGAPTLFAPAGEIPDYYQPGPAATKGTATPAAGVAGAGQPAQGLPLSVGPGGAPRNVDAGGLDWGLVNSPPPGVAQVGSPTRGVEPTESGRLYILELYQEVLDQRDALELEVAALTAELEQVHTRMNVFEGSLQAEKSRAATLEAEKKALRSEVQDLAARLTTAQIRRLESEKLLLESKIQWQRAALDESRRDSTAGPNSGLALGSEGR